MNYQSMEQAIMHMRTFSKTSLLHHAMGTFTYVNDKDYNNEYKISVDDQLVFTARDGKATYFNPHHYNRLASKVQDAIRKYWDVSDWEKEVVELANDH